MRVCFLSGSTVAELQEEELDVVLQCDKPAPWDCYGRSMP